MNALAGIFGMAVRARNLLYDRGAFKTRRLAWPVVSVGNIRAGGTGKTPFIIKLGQMLQERGIAFDVLSRGYGRDDENSIKLVEPKGAPADFGDEPLLISQALGVPVIVGADRYAAGRFAERIFAEARPAHGGKWIHLLDDGFQHRRLHRDFDIVLVSPSDADDALLPAGHLREPVSSLRRADVVVLMDGAATEGLLLTTQKVWRAKRKTVAESLPQSVIAFCGVARPETFFEDMRNLGVNIADKRSFADHHAYGEADIRDLRLMRDDKQAAAFVTTEKDAINLRRNTPQALQQLEPLKVVKLEIELEEPQAALADLLQACRIEQLAETINSSS